MTMPSLSALRTLAAWCTLAGALLTLTTACGRPPASTQRSVCGNEEIEEPDEVCDGFNLAGMTCTDFDFNSGFLACSSDCTHFDISGCVLSECGNGIIEGTESCEGDDLRGATCESLGFEGGTLACLNCAFDITGCTGLQSVCGDNERTNKEVCDGSDLNGATCDSLGFDGGTLSCKSDCSGFNTGGCTGIGPVCGDGVAQGNEACDGKDLKGADCQSAVQMPYGTVTCTAQCELDVSNCSSQPVCGNQSAEHGEVCDGPDLKGATCVSQGYDGGRLGCQPDCLGYNTTECEGTGFVCGNNKVEGSEQCDGADFAGKNCVLLGFTGGALACNANCVFDTSGCTGTQAVCGDNVVEGIEVCDGTDLGGRDCTDAGFDGGTLACSSDCRQFDTSGCTRNPVCGNGSIEGTEVCDGNNVGGATCISRGYDGGTLRCQSTCGAFDESGCYKCGDNLAQGLERCDGTDLKGATCSSLGYITGTLACGPTCAAYDTSGCSNTPVCGDNQAHGSEICDGTDLRGETCTSRNFTGGTLACNSNCTGFDTTACTGPVEVCGNGTIGGTEACDGPNLGGRTCQSEGFAGGTLACSSNCTLDVSGCTGGTCGDGVRQTGEECDGADLAGAGCASLGFSGGTLGCTPSCTFDTTACTTGPICGNQIIEGTEQCDDTNLGGQTCESRGFAGGTLACSSNCTFDTSGCIGTPVCGNGVKEGTEVCDGNDVGTQQCSDFGFTGGTLSCNASCNGFTFTGCTGGTASFCGDGVPGEDFCDGDAWVIGPSCADFGLGTGTMTCTAQCIPDTSSCSNPDYCDANNYYNDGWCDPCELMGGIPDPDCAHCGAADGFCSEYYGPGGFTCQRLGTPDPDCGTCGNGIAEGSELCDGNDILYSCTDGFYAGGTIGCQPDCTLDFTNCIAPTCGDGVAHGAEECDGADLDGTDCRALGFQGGTLGCTASCTFDTSACFSTPACCSTSTGPGCAADPAIAACVCAEDPFCCNVAWDSQCVAEVDSLGCGTCSTGPVCGNGTAEAGEECDGGDHAGQTCSSLGFTGGGTLTCDANCEFDTSNCQGAPACGNNLREGTEVCDGTDVGGQSCTDYGFTGGTLGCAFTCDRLDFSNCTGTAFNACGDGVPGLHVCDGTSFRYGAPSCHLAGLGAGTITCDADCNADFSDCSIPDLCEGMGWYNDFICDPCEAWGGTPDPDCAYCGDADGYCIEWPSAAGYTCQRLGTPDPDCGICGNGKLEGSELCDGSDIGVSCTGLGYVGGTITSCLADCTPNLSDCVAPTCGDGVAEGWEYCDGGDLNGDTCRSLGFTGGQLACNAQCNGFDTSACTGSNTVCGNGLREPGEVCDGDDLNGQDCTGFGFSGGQLACNSNCNGYDMLGCTGGNIFCGDGVPGKSLCDGDGWRLGGPSCEIMGMGTGTATCDANCEADFSTCSAPVDLCAAQSPPWYNDGICDPCDLMGGTRDPDCDYCGQADGFCISYSGLYGSTCGRLGTPDPDCTCGNGVVEGGETCDGTDLAGRTCASFGYAGGTLGCLSDCTPNLSACTPPTCGNNVAEGFELCDGTDTDGWSCSHFGFTGGTLLCNGTCNGFDTSGCTGSGPVCGNGIIDSGEECDGANLGGQTCEGLGFAGGTLACGGGCTFDTSGCHTNLPCCTATPGTAGCAEDLSVESCVCNIDSWCCNNAWDSLCALWAAESCGACPMPKTAECGDGASGLDFCDGTDFFFGTSACSAYGLGSGTIACTSDCLPDLTACTGDGSVCTGMGWYNDGICDPCSYWGGIPDDDCAALCGADGICSEWYIQGVFSCEAEGYGRDPDCVDLCGNGVLDGSDRCEGSNHGSATCADYGYTSGTLSCTSDCIPSFGSCQ